MPAVLLPVPRKDCEAKNRITCKADQDRVIPFVSYDAYTSPKKGLH